MFMITAPDGSEKYLVQLVGPKSYRMGELKALRGQSLPVSKRTRDYLVRRTGGAWVDFDPTPAEPVEEILPPQFGEVGGPAIDMADIDPTLNPAMSVDLARRLAMNGAEVAQGRYTPGEDGIDTADLAATPVGAPSVPDGSGDMTGKDLKASTQAQGGQTAKKGLVVSTKPAQTVNAVPKNGAVTVD